MYYLCISNASNQVQALLLLWILFISPSLCLQWLDSSFLLDFWFSIMFAQLINVSAVKTHNVIGLTYLPFTDSASRSLVAEVQRQTFNSIPLFLSQGIATPLTELPFSCILSSLFPHPLLLKQLLQIRKFANLLENTLRPFLQSYYILADTDALWIILIWY